MEEDLAVVVVEGAAAASVVEDIPKDSLAVDAVVDKDSHKAAKMAKEVVEEVDSAAAAEEVEDAVAATKVGHNKIDHRPHAHTRAKVDANPTKENNALFTMLINNKINNSSSSNSQAKARPFPV